MTVVWEIWERHETALSSVINNWAPWIDRPMIGFYIEVISYRSNLSFCRNTTADRPWKSFSTQTHLRSVLIERMNYQKCESLKIVVYNWKPNSFLIIGMLQWHSIIRGDQQLPGESGLIIHSVRGCIRLHSSGSWRVKMQGLFPHPSRWLQDCPPLTLCLAETK